MARRLFPAQFLLDSNGNPVPNAPFKVYSDLVAGSEVTDLVGLDGVSPLPKNGGFFLAGNDSNTPHVRGPNTTPETVMLFIDSGAGVRYEWHAVDALQEAMLRTGTTGGLPAGTTLEQIPNGTTRFAVSSAERTRIANGVQNMGGFGRVWGRTATQGFPTAADGALDGDWLFIDGTPA